MISYLKGVIKSVSRNEIILDVNGVGYSVFVTKKILERIPSAGSGFEVLTYLDVKENSMMLFGFGDDREREIFKMLISVNGISAKTANTILSHATFEEIISLITSVHGAAGVKIPGIGPKKIELISVALKDKIYKISQGADTDTQAGLASAGGSAEQSRLEALTALMNLGYQRSEAEKIIREILKANPQEILTTEELIKKSLNYISGV
jgi:Holliday junction DNA helicase RuvA